MRCSASRPTFVPSIFQNHGGATDTEKKEGKFGGTDQGTPVGSPLRTNSSAFLKFPSWWRRSTGGGATEAGSANASFPDDADGNRKRGAWDFFGAWRFPWSSPAGEPPALLPVRINSTCVQFDWAHLSLVQSRQGFFENSPAFQRWVERKRCRVPTGTAERRAFFFRPGRDLLSPLPPPTDKSVGYFRSSLRDGNKRRGALP